MMNQEHQDKKQSDLLNIMLILVLKQVCHILENQLLVCAHLGTVIYNCFLRNHVDYFASAIGLNEKW